MVFLARGSLPVITVVLLVTVVLGQAAYAGRIVLVSLPSHPVVVDVHDEGEVSVMLVSLFKRGSAGLVHVIGGRYQGWYRLVLGNVSFSARSALFLRGDKLYIYGVYGTVKPWFYELMPVLATVSLRTGQGTVETMATLGNGSLRIVPVGASLEPCRQPYVFYAANILGRSTNSNSSSDVFVPEGLLLARIRLGERPEVVSLFFPARNVLFTAHLVVGGTVYVAGVHVEEVKEVTEKLPSSTAIVVGAVHRDVMTFHEYRVPGCSLPRDIYVSNNALYLSCMGGHDFSLVLLALDLATWEPLWSASYNASTMVFGARDTPLVVMNNRLYVPITNGLAVIDTGTGKPLKAITLATTPTHPRLGLVGITTIHILSEPYVVVVNYTNSTITQIPLRLLENTECIRVGSVALGETKLARTRLRPVLLGVEKVKGRQLPLVLTKIATIGIEKYNNVTEKHPEIAHLRTVNPYRAD